MEMRLDKYLSNMGVGSRREVRLKIQRGKARVNDEVIRLIDYKVKPEEDTITFYGEMVTYSEYIYLMLNKPSGCITATEDLVEKTVLDLIKHGRKKTLFPVGRLDKDTEGLLILTNDGKLAHKLLAPKSHVAKVYYAKIEGCVTLDDIKIFKLGIWLDDRYKTLPAKLNIISAGDISEIEVTIYEGKFHQIKRMFEAVGKKVIYLKRLEMGGLKLDEELKPGDYKELMEADINRLKKG